MRSKFLDFCYKIFYQDLRIRILDVRKHFDERITLIPSHARSGVRALGVWHTGIRLRVWEIASQADPTITENYKSNLLFFEPSSYPSESCIFVKKNHRNASAYKKSLEQKVFIVSDRGKDLGILTQSSKHHPHKILTPWISEFAEYCQVLAC